MKSLNEFMSDAAFIIARSAMPQIRDVPAFTSYLKSMGIDYYETSTPTGELRPTQTNYDKEHVDDIAHDIRDNPNHTLPPIIVSNDMFVADGHHRFLGAKEEGININAVVVDLPINKLLSVMYDYSET